jgi:hypothetical protein
MARLVRTLRVRRGATAGQGVYLALAARAGGNRAWSVRCACGAARHVSELERYLKCAVREQQRVELPRTTAR